MIITSLWPAPARKNLRWLEEPTRINGSFRFPSIYRGDPTPEIDEAWSKLTDSRLCSLSLSIQSLTSHLKKVGSMRVSEDELNIIDPTFKESAVKYPDIMGGGYMGSLEVFHQLHCIVSHSTSECEFR